MSGQQGSQLSKAAQARLGLPEGFQVWSAGKLGGMNQQDARTAMEDQEFFWLENVLLVGKGQFRTLWDRGADLYTQTGNTVLSFFPFIQNQTPYHMVFFTDGTAVAVNQLTAAVVTVSNTPGTFYVTSAPPQPSIIAPACVQWGSRYLLISNNHNSNAYWVWDSTLLYGTGGSGPIATITNGGSGYTSAPTVMAVGGSGSGWTGVATVIGGSVVSVQVTSPGTGYSPLDQPQLQFSGGGSDTGAILTAVLGAGVVNSIEIISGGAGYSSAPTITISGGGGSGATAVATLTGGVVTTITVTDQGSGYTSTPSVAFSGSGGASAVAILSVDGVSSVTVVNGGSGYVATPAIAFVGGGGSGATAVVTIAGGAITGVTMTDGGSGYTEPPSIVIGGQNNAAYGNLQMMPFGISGNSMETFDSRVWISYPHDATTTDDNGGVFNVSAPESFTDFAQSDGGDLYTSADRYLRAQYVLLRQSNGYLYPFGDSSASVVSNVQTSGTPTVTTFSYQNTDPQLGVAWRDSAQDFSRTILFANSTGVYGLYGGAVRRVSSKINDVFVNAVFPPNAGALTPSSAVASLYTIRCYLLLMTITDPYTKVIENKMIMWDEANWYVASQSTSLTYIATQEIDSQLTAWGTDGTSLFPLFATPSSALTKTLRTKLYGNDKPFVIKEALDFYLTAEDKSAAQAGISLNVTMDASGIATQIDAPADGLSVPALPEESAPLPVQPNFLAPLGTLPTWAGRTPDMYGTAMGANIVSTSPDFVVAALALGYTEITAAQG
jgi:hypothetical protein